MGYFLKESYNNIIIEKIKSGPQRADYKIFYRDVNKSSYHFPKPVVVIINQNSCSSSDLFAVGLQKLCNISLLGDADIKYASIGNTRSTELPNGWLIQFGTGWYTYEGVNYKDGDYIQVDIEIHNNSEKIANGIDSQLQAAVHYLNNQIRDSKTENQIN